MIYIYIYTVYIIYNINTERFRAKETNLSGVVFEVYEDLCVRFLELHDTEQADFRMRMMGGSVDS